MNINVPVIVNVIDVGARGGLHERWNYIKNLQAILFEADLEEAQKLKVDSKNIVIEKAISNTNDNITINLCKKRGVSSVLEPNMELLKKFPNSQRFTIEDKVEIEATTIDTVLKELELGCHFLKLDVQGYEKQILDGSLDSLKSVIGIEIEVSHIEIYLNQVLFKEINEFLTSKEFDLVDISKVYWRENDELYGKGTLVTGDALYLKSPKTLLLNKESKETFYQAFAIYLVYGYYNLAKELLVLALEKGLIEDSKKKELELTISDFAHNVFLSDASKKDYQTFKNQFSENPDWVITTADNYLGNL